MTIAKFFGYGDNDLALCAAVDILDAGCAGREESSVPASHQLFISLWDILKRER